MRLRRVCVRAHVSNRIKDPNFTQFEVLEIEICVEMGESRAKHVANRPESSASKHETASKHTRAHANYDAGFTNNDARPPLPALLFVVATILLVVVATLLLVVVARLLLFAVATLLVAVS